MSMNREQPKPCKRLADAAAWALHALTPAEAQRFQTHLEHCAQCADEVAATLRTVQAVREAPQRTPSADLTERIMQEALPSDAPLATPRRRPFVAAWIAAAAALIILCGFVFYTLNREHQMTPHDLRAQALAQQTRQAADWIVDQQDADGAWSPSRTGGNEAYRPALTALAILALQRQAPTEYADAIRRGANALVAMQTETGAFCRNPGAQLYNHAFATTALLALPPELAQAPAIQAAGKRAIAFSLQAQNAQGAWDYARDGSGNTALSVWQIALLAQARQQGWSDSGGHLRRGLAWLQQQSNGHEFGYRSPGVPQPGHSGITLTAMSAATLLDAARTYPALQSAADAATDALRALRTKQDCVQADYYRDYFLARVSTQQDDGKLKKEVVARLNAQCAATAGGGVCWVANDAWRTSGGDLYATTLAMLSQRL